MSARGLRNNNPGNIRLGSQRWKGEMTPSRDRDFVQFETMAWGYRAMFVLLDTYRRKYGARTISDIINRYAPANENDTAAYIRAVSAAAGIAAAAPVPFADPATMVRIVAAMSRVENGVAAAMDDVRAGWDLFVGK